MLVNSPIWQNQEDTSVTASSYDILARFDGFSVTEKATAYAETIFCFTLAIIFLTYAIRRLAPKAFTGISPGILSPVGGIFALTASFLIADVWNKNTNSLDIVASETQAVHQIFNISSSLPAPLCDIIRSKVEDYRRLVLGEEAPALSHMKTIDNDINARARKLLYEISAATADRPEPVAGRIFDLSNQIFKYRNQRLAIVVDVTQSRRIELTTILAFFLILAVATTHSENLTLMTTMSLATATIATIVVAFAIYNGRPFDDDVSMLNEGGFFSSAKDMDLINKNPINHLIPLPSGKQKGALGP